MDIAKYITDKDAAANGKWIDLGDGARIKVARWNNARFRELEQRLKRPYRSYALSGRELPQDVAERIAIELLVETVLLDWQGIALGGAAMPYGKAAAKDLLDKSEWFRNQVSYHAMLEENFYRQEIAELEKNSASASAGT